MHWSKSERCRVVGVEEEVRKIHGESIQLDVEHARAHHTEKEKQDMTLFKKLVTEENESADELVKDGAMLDGCEMSQIRANTVQQKKRG